MLAALATSGTQGAHYQDVQRHAADMSPLPLFNARDQMRTRMAVGRGLRAGGGLLLVTSRFGPLAADAYPSPGVLGTLAALSINKGLARRLG